MFSPQAGRRQPCPLPPHTPSSNCHFNALRAIAGGNPAKEWARNGFATPSDGFQSNSGYRLPLDLMHGKLARGSLTESTGDYRRRRVRGRLTDTRAVKGRSGIPPFGGHFVHKTVSRGRLTSWCRSRSLRSRNPDHGCEQEQQEKLRVHLSSPAVSASWIACSCHIRPSGGRYVGR